jgi:hypothetical protein
VATFERVTYRPEGAKRSRSVILRDPSGVMFAGSSATTGVEVGLDGSELAPAGVDERRHIIADALISKREPMTMNLHYARLEPRR